MIITHIGGPTVLIEVDGWTLLTDPTFDPAGGHYAFGWGTSSDKVSGPAISVSDLPPIDAVLLTHDHHGDNLDKAGRALLATVPVVLTTGAGARRLSMPGVRGLRAGEVTRLTSGHGEIEVLATPARHGPPLSGPIVGEVVGFALRRAGSEVAFLWITGDTVLFPGLRRVAEEMSVEVALVHVGGVQFPITGPLRYTMTGREAVSLIGICEPRVALPVHYEGWSHFKDGPGGLQRAVAAAPEAVRRRFRTLEIGTPTEVG